MSALKHSNLVCHFALLNHIKDILFSLIKQMFIKYKKRLFSLFHNKSTYRYQLMSVIKPESTKDFINISGGLIEISLPVWSL